MSRAFVCDGCGAVEVGICRRSIRVDEQRWVLGKNWQTQSHGYDLCEACFDDLTTNFLDGGGA